MVKIDKERIKRAIQRAERRTSGEICVSLAQPFWGDVWKAAERAFDRLGMAATRDRNAVLFFVVPARHRLVVLGDSGINERVDDDFWLRIVHGLSDHFHHSDFTGGIIAGIEAVGQELAKHFPRLPGDTNELPDEVDDPGTLDGNPGN